MDRGLRFPYEGQLLHLPRDQGPRLKVEGAKDAKLRKRLTDELDWVRSNPKARQAKSKARCSATRRWPQRPSGPRKLDFEEIQIPPGPRLGNVVVVAEHVMKGYGDRLLMDDVTSTCPRNGIVGVIGPNGVGKTTLFKMIVHAAGGPVTRHPTRDDPGR